MSRTTRTDRAFRRNAARDGQGFCCPGGKGCGVCMDNRRVSIIRGSLHQAEDVAEWLLEPWVAEARPDGGVDESWGYRTCWGTRIGLDPECRCEACSEMWGDLAWPLWGRIFDEVFCETCGGECTL